MPEIDQLALAIVTGLGFGYFVTLLGSSPQRLAMMLFALWALQTLAQQLFRAMDGRDVSNEVIMVSTIRLVFAASAVSFVYLWGKRR